MPTIYGTDTDCCSGGGSGADNAIVSTVNLTATDGLILVKDGSNADRLAKTSTKNIQSIVISDTDLGVLDEALIVKDSITSNRKVKNTDITITEVDNTIKKVQYIDLLGTDQQSQTQFNTQLYVYNIDNQIEIDANSDGTNYIRSLLGNLRIQSDADITLFSNTGNLNMSFTGGTITQSSTLNTVIGDAKFDDNVVIDGTLTVGTNTFVFDASTTADSLLNVSNNFIQTITGTNTISATLHNMTGGDLQVNNDVLVGSGANTLKLSKSGNSYLIEASGDLLIDALGNGQPKSVSITCDGVQPPAFQIDGATLFNINRQSIQLIDEKYIQFGNTASAPAIPATGGNLYSTNSKLYFNGIDLTILNNYGASLAPSTGDDINSGYSIGSIWIDTTNNKSYLSIDNTASNAVWREFAFDQSLNTTDDVLFNRILGTETRIGTDSGTNQGANSIAIGYQSGSNQGTLSVALGYQAGINQPAYSNNIGYQSYANEFSNALGWQANASASQSVAIGYIAKAQGQLACAIGNVSEANNTECLSIGNNVKNSGLRSTCIGSGINNTCTDVIVLRTGVPPSFTCTNDSAFYVQPIRQESYTGHLSYDNTSKEVSHNTYLLFEDTSTLPASIPTNQIILYKDVAQNDLFIRDSTNTSYKIIKEDVFTALELRVAELERKLTNLDYNNTTMATEISGDLDFV